MKDLIGTNDSVDDIQGKTLEERAKLVLLTLGRTSGEIKAAYRKRACEHHPDASQGDKMAFQLIHEAYLLLTGQPISKRPLLSDDVLVERVAGCSVKPLLDKQKEWEKYERWRRKQFYSDWGMVEDD